MGRMSELDLDRQQISSIELHPLLRPRTISITQAILTVMFSMIAGTYVAIFSLMVWP